MVHSGDVSSGRRVRRWQLVSEMRQIVQLTLEPGASVAEVARVHGLAANQVFKWRRAFERGELVDSRSALLPVMISSPSKSDAESVEQPPQTHAASSDGRSIGGASCFPTAEDSCRGSSRS